ncbi:MAG: hypothetical protein Q8O67_04660 [Deltaproteobacteria bacterium]|nr:hypothetical protein [Deltaproteobacteria bacterium]
MMTPVLLLSVLATTAPTLEDARVMTGIVAAAAARNVAVDVLTASDLRTATDLAASQQMLGCTEQSACLAEIAAALDARVVISGTLGTLGDELVLQLSAFNVDAAKSLGRTSLRATRVQDLATPAEETIAQLLLEPSKDPKGGKLRVLVLDLELASGAKAAAAEPAPSSLNVMAIGGGSMAAVGVVAVVVGVVFDVQSADLFTATSNDPGLSAAKANEQYDDSDFLGVIAGLAYGTGAVLVIGGAALIAVGLSE